MGKDRQYAEESDDVMRGSEEFQNQWTKGESKRRRDNERFFEVGEVPVRRGS